MNTTTKEELANLMADSGKFEFVDATAYGIVFMTATGVFELGVTQLMLGNSGLLINLEVGWCEKVDVAGTPRQILQRLTSKIKSF